MANKVNKMICKTLHIKSILTYFLLVLSFLARGNDEFQQYAFKNLSIKDGLSQNTALSIFQDKQGFIWIGTYDGLNRYDGRKFISFMPTTTGKNTLLSGTIYSICDDNEGTLYFGTYGGGLSVYDPVSSTMTNYTETNCHGTDAITSDFIFKLRKDANGIIWIAGRNGVSAFDPKTKTIQTWSSRNGKFPKATATDINFDTDGNVWASTIGQGICKLNSKENKFLALELNRTGGDLYRINNVNNIQWLSSNKLMLATDGGLFIYNTESETYSNPFDIHYTINAVYLDSRKNLWIGSQDHNLVVITADSKKNEIVSDRYQSTSIISSKVSVFFEDREGGLWFGLHGNGVALTNLYQKPFLHLYHEVNSPSIVGNEIYALEKTSDGNVWIGTTAGLSLWDRKKESFTSYTAENNYLKINQIWALQAISNDSLWIGGSNGLYLFNKNKGIVKSYYHKLNDTTSIASNDISCIRKDSKGRLWVGTTNGLSILSRDGKTFHNFGDEKSCGLSFNTIWDIFEDKDGQIWVGTEKGINRYNEQTGRFKSYLYNPNDSCSLINNDITTIHQGKSGRIWICTRLGVCYYNEKSDNFVRLTIPELMNRFSYAAIEDGDYLWVSTNKGLACINLTNNTLKYFEVGDGIQSNEFNPPALKLDDNMILFGGINGITAFYTAQIEKDINRVPKLYFTSLKVDGQLIEIGKPVEKSKHNIKRQVEYAGKLRLEPHEKILSLEFSALEYFAPERIRYYYRILPNSPNWIPLKDQNFVTFVNLNPGEYTLQVRSTNSDGQQVDNIRTMNIVVDPPYYQTFWFIALCILVVAGLVFLAIRMRFIGLQRNTIVLEKEVMERTKKIETQKREIEIQRNIASHQRDKITEQRDQLERLMQNLELKVKERTLELEIAKFKAEESDRLKSAFLSNMSHEIRTPMNAIIGFSELLLEQSFDPDEKQGFAELIRSNGDHLLNLLNDIIDISMIESGQLKLVPSRISFNDLINDVYLNFKRHQTLIAKQDKVNFILKPLSQNITLYTDPLRVKQVLYNLVSNAIKFTAEGAIEMGYEINGSMIHVYVQDSGIGIAPENQKYVFERFRKIDGGKRNLYGGFGLGLTISRNLIESLGGRIWLESYVGKGTTFYFTLPLTNEQRPNNHL